MKRLGARVDDVIGPERMQEFDVFGLADDVDEPDAVVDADPVEHEPEVGGPDGVDQRRVTLGSHRLDHAERGERIHERRCGIGRVGAVVPSAGTG